MDRLKLSLLVWSSVAIVAPRVHATVIPISDDTYLDSTYSVYNGTVVADTQNTAFDTYAGTSGSSKTPSNQRVKVVSSNGSSQFPGNSKVHALFKLPQAFWDEVDNGTAKGAIVSFTVFNNSLLNSSNPTDLRDVELHPMTRRWTTTTATWRTTDGTTPWSTADVASDHDDPGTGGGGGDYDLARLVDTVNPNVASGSLVQWDLTPFFADSVAMSELRLNGALLKETNETSFAGNRFYIAVQRQRGRLDGSVRHNGRARARDARRVGHGGGRGARAATPEGDLMSMRIAIGSAVAALAVISLGPVQTLRADDATTTTSATTRPAASAGTVVSVAPNAADGVRCCGDCGDAARRSSREGSRRARRDVPRRAAA